MTRVVETSIMRASFASVAWRTEALEFPAVVVASGAILLWNTGGAIFAGTIFASLSSQFAEASVITARTDAFVGTGRR